MQWRGVHLSECSVIPAKFSLQLPRSEEDSTPSFVAPIVLLIVLVFILLPHVVHGAEDSFEEIIREVPASEILSKIQDGKSVEYDHIIVKGDLDLSHLSFQKNITSYIRINDSVFDGLVSFDYKNFSEPVDFSGSNFTKNAGFNNSHFAGYTHFIESTFSGDVWFTESTFHWADAWSFIKADDGHIITVYDVGLEWRLNLARSTRDRFDRSVEFNGARFNGDARFTGARFGRWGGAVFNEARFNEDVWFDRAEFGPGAEYNGARFNGRADFSKATFYETADFSKATFYEDIVFSETMFYWGAKFNGATFYKYALFTRATFNGYAGFLKAIFNENAMFAGATFRDSKFNGARFNGEAWFGKATFYEDADFSEAFYEDIWFSGATFNGDVWFINATFNRYAVFEDTTFNENVVFQGAIFNGRAWSTGAAFNGYLIGWSEIKNSLISDEVTYLRIIKNFRDHGQFDDADDCYYQYRIRKMSLEFQDGNVTGFLSDMLSLVLFGYGVKLGYTFFLALFIIFTFSLWFSSYVDGDLIKALRISVITILSLPSDWLGSEKGKYSVFISEHIIAATLERLIGWSLLIILVNTLSRLMILY